MQMVTRAIQCYTSLFSHPTKFVSVSFIHALGPSIVEYVEEKGKTCSSKEVATNVTEAIKLLEYLVQLVDDSNNSKLSFYWYCVYIFDHRAAYAQFVNSTPNFFTCEHRKVKFFI